MVGDNQEATNEIVPNQQQTTNMTRPMTQGDALRGNRMRLRVDTKNYNISDAKRGHVSGLSGGPINEDPE